MNSFLIKKALVVNENNEFYGSVLIEDGIIKEIFDSKDSIPESIVEKAEEINAEGKILFPGIIDDQVHFREPGLEHKADIKSESRAAIAGGVTSFMEMPNTKPQTTTIEKLEQKFELASENSYANYSFYFGATNDNLAELKKIDPANVCGIKIFMGSSTGNMLVDNQGTLERIFANAPTLITTHCEDEVTIQNNLKKYKEKFGDNIPIAYHPVIRSAEACYLSSSKAVQLAKKHGARLHILHLSTAKELELFDKKIPGKEKKITAEACIHHLWFQDTDYKKMGTKIKWNPAIKSEKDRNALIEGINSNKIDIIATDHAPHTIDEKSNNYIKAPSGGPMVQHSLLAMLDLYHHGLLSLSKIAEKMCHAPADIFNVSKRGYIRKGYWADLVLVDPHKDYTVTRDNLLYKCRWSPMEGHTFQSSVTHTFLNGHLVYDNGNVKDFRVAKRLEFNR